MSIKVPKKKVKNRNSMIIKYCNGKKVLHIGACDSPFTKEKYNGDMGALLYREIDKVCDHQLGIDLDINSVNFLNSKKEDFPRSEVQCLDMNKLEVLDYQPDIIIFGEVIEHLMNLETALSNIKKVMNKDTLLIISTPNAYCFEGILGNLLGYEFFHEDHKITFSYGLLKNLLKYNGLKEKDFYYCKIDHQGVNLYTKILNFISKNIVYYIFPRFYDNLLFICKKN